MNKNPLWILVVLVSLLVVFVDAIVLFVPNAGYELINAHVNPRAILWLSFWGYLSIAAYSIFRTNKDLHKGEYFTKLTDKDKYLDLIEDMMELEDKALYLARRAKKNTEKLSIIGKELFPKNKEHNL